MSEPPVIKPMPQGRVYLAVVAPARGVGRDLRRSFPWLACLLLVTLVYVLGSAAFVRIWEREWSLLHACYFTVINMTTVGFGDVVPLTRVGKLVAGANAFVGLLLFGALVAVVALALQPSSWSGTLALQDRETPETRPDREGPDDGPMQRGTAELLAGLGKLIDTAGDPARGEPLLGRVRVDVSQLGRKHAHIEVIVHVDVG